MTKFTSAYVVKVAVYNVLIQKTDLIQYVIYADNEFVINCQYVVFSMLIKLQKWYQAIFWFGFSFNREWQSVISLDILPVST